MFALGFKYHKTCRRRSPPVRHVDFWRPQKMPTFSRVLELSTWAIKPIRNIFLRLLAQSQVQEESKPFYQTARILHFTTNLLTKLSCCSSKPLWVQTRSFSRSLDTHKKFWKSFWFWETICVKLGIESFLSPQYVLWFWVFKKISNIWFKTDKSCVEVFATGEASQYLFNRPFGRENWNKGKP